MALVYTVQRLLARSRLSHLLVVLAACLLLSALAGLLVALLTPLYALALAIGTMAGLLILRSRQMALLAIVAVICLLPFASLPLNIGFSPTFLNLALGAYFLVWIMRIATRRQEPWVNAPLVPAVAAVLLFTFGSFVSGLGHAHLSATALRKFAEIPLGIAVFFAVLNNVREQRDLEQVTLWLILGGAIAAAIGILLYFIPHSLAIRLLSALRVVRYPSGPDVLRYIEDNPDLALRAISTSIDPNVLGALMTLTMGLAAPHLLAPKPFIRRRWLLLCMGLCAGCLLLTYSRSSMAGLVVGIACLGLLPGYRKILLALPVGLVLVLLLPQTRGYVTHFIEGVRLQDLATQMRLGEYKDAFILIQRYPWLGVGFIDAPDIDLYLGVSCLYLLIAEEMGLVGLAAYLLSQVVFFADVLIAWRIDWTRGGAFSPWLLGPAVAILGGLAAGILDHTLFSFSHALTLFWVIVALGAVAARRARLSDA